MKGLTSLAGKGHDDVIVKPEWYRYDRKKAIEGKKKWTLLLTELLALMCRAESWSGM